MSTSHPVIASWARSAVVPRGGAFKALQAHEIAAPVVHAALQRAGLDATQVDALVLGNALGAGGNPARMLALHAGLPQHCPAFTIDTQCCAGLDAVTMAIGLISSGQAEVVIAGGVEAWSRSPIRMHRPLHKNEPPIAYERPAFTPRPEQDPDMLLSAARYAAQAGYTRAQQEAYALRSHALAVAHADQLTHEIVSIAGVLNDVYPRVITPERAQRMPVVARTDAASDAQSDTFGLSALTISAQADGAALVVLIAPSAASRLGIPAQVSCVATSSVGNAPECPLLSAEVAARAVLARAGLTDAKSLASVELHDAFAVQGLSFAKGLALAPHQLNPFGGGIARGHPIGASAAVALVRLLAQLKHLNTSGTHGLVAVAGAGGLGSAALISYH